MNGVIIINKPQKFTSFDVVAVIRKLTGQRKIGHTGTLDPNATGVLPILLGNATKAQDIVPNHDKSYTAKFRLGMTTDTLDIWGAVTSQSDKTATEADVLSALENFRGEIEQLPPMYSAIKVNGQRLYDLARQGKEVERKPRKVTVYRLELKDFDEESQSGTLNISCSKGTYIRTLCNDVGEVLGVGGCMESLLRTKVSRFELKDSMKLADIEKAKNEGRTEEIILPLDEVFVEYPKIIVTGRQAQLAYNGNPFPKESAKNLILPGKDGGEDDLSDIFSRYKKYRVYDEQGRFIAIYSYQKQRQLFRIEKMFFDPDGK